MTAYTDFHYSPTGSGVISGAQVLEQTEQGINGLGQYVQDNVSGAIDVANEALTTAQSADSNATTAINLANSFNAQIIAANQTAGNALTTAQSAQNTANSASSLATTANNSAATALNAANSASAGVTTLTGTVNSLGNRMTAAENNISTNAGNITTLQNNLATTNANVTAASNAANAAQATATSAQATATLARNQAYVLRYTGTTITGGGTITYADIDNTDNIKAGDKIIDISGAIYNIASVDTANETVTVGASPVINLFCDAENLIPAANDAYDLGSSSYQWNNLYAKNYYYNGTAWGLNKDNTWAGNNEFKAILALGNNGEIWFKNSKIDDFTTNPAVYGSKSVLQLWNKYSTQYSGGLIDYQTTDGSHIFEIACFGYPLNDSTPYQHRFRFAAFRNGGADFYPTYTNSVNLGTSTNKWKSFNGINPGALSLPDFSAEFDVSGQIVPPTGESQISINWGKNTFTPSVNGWLSVRIHKATVIKIYREARASYCFDSRIDSANDICVCSPVVAGVEYTIKIQATQFSSGYDHFRLAPCQGNV